MAMGRADFIGTVLGLLFLMIGFATAGFFTTRLGSLLAAVFLGLGLLALFLVERR